jgi:hypothetical protein
MIVKFFGVIVRWSLQSGSSSWWLTLLFQYFLVAACHSLRSYSTWSSSKSAKFVCTVLLWVQGLKTKTKTLPRPQLGFQRCSSF